MFRHLTLVPHWFVLHNIIRRVDPSLRFDVLTCAYGRSKPSTAMVITPVAQFVMELAPERMARVDQLLEVATSRPSNTTAAIMRLRKGHSQCNMPSPPSA